MAPCYGTVVLSDGRKRRVHQDQVRKCTLDPNLHSELVPEPEVTDEVLPVPCTEDQPATVADTGASPETEQEPPAAPPEATGEGSSTPTPPQGTPPRSTPCPAGGENVSKASSYCTCAIRTKVVTLCMCCVCHFHLSAKGGGNVVS